MTHSGHRIVKCKCGTVIEQCRCMRKDKAIIYETCDACKIIAFHQKEEKENEG